MITRWLWWLFGPVNLWLREREYRRAMSDFPTWRWNDHLEHCPRCGRDNMTEHAYESLQWCEEDGGTPSAKIVFSGHHGGYCECGGRGSSWTAEITCDRCGHVYDHEDSSC